jgi:hypothetical protein
MIFQGYREKNAKDELYLLRVLRSTKDLNLAKDICTALKRAGGLIPIPTLMALAKDKDEKALLAKDAIGGIKSRVKPEEKNELSEFFTPTYWQPVWHGGPEKFLSYVAFLSNMFSEEPFNNEAMDTLAEQLISEMHVDLSPYQSFSALRLSQLNWDQRRDVNLLITELEEGLTLNNALNNTDVIRNPDGQEAENLIFMKCDYLLTRLKLDVEEEQIRTMLKIANVLDQP